MKNIDVTNGNVYLDGISYTVTKHLTREEFLQLDCLKKGPESKYPDNYGYSLTLCQIGGKIFYPTFYFKGSKLIRFDLRLEEQMRDYNTKRFDFKGYEAIFKAWLVEQLGTPSHIDQFGRVSYQFKWGEVMYEIDPKNMTNKIILSYAINDKSEYH